jgi:predicted DNA-binding transcriptional regulator AlpA
VEKGGAVRSRRPLLELPEDLQRHRCLGKEEVAVLMGISPKTVDQAVYGDSKRGIAPWGPPSFLIGRRRVWRLKDVVAWINRAAREGAR